MNRFEATAGSLMWIFVQVQVVTRAMPLETAASMTCSLIFFVCSSQTAGKEAHCCGLIGQLLNGAAPLLQICNLHLVVVVLLSSPSQLPKSSMCLSPSYSQQLTTDPLSPPSLPLPSGPSSVTGSLLEGGFKAASPCALNGLLRKGLFGESHGEGSDAAVEAETPRYFYFRNTQRLPSSGVNGGGKVSLSPSPPGTTSPTPTRASSPTPSHGVQDPRQQSVLDLSRGSPVPASGTLSQKIPLTNAAAPPVSSAESGPVARPEETETKSSHDESGSNALKCQDATTDNRGQGDSAVGTKERSIRPCAVDYRNDDQAEGTSCRAQGAAGALQSQGTNEEGETVGRGSFPGAVGASCTGGGGGDSVGASSLLERGRNSSTLPKHFEEEDLIRNTSHAQFGLLELSRFLPNFTVKFIPTSVPDVHVYKALPKLSRPTGSGSSSRGKPVAGVTAGNPGAPPTRGAGSSSGGGGGTTARAAPGQRAGGGSRYFVRVLVTVVVGPGQFNRGAGPCRGRSAAGSQDGVDGDELEGILSEQERHFVCGLNALEVSCKAGDVDAMAGNHLLLSTSILFSNGNAFGSGHGGRPSGTHYPSGGMTVHRVGPGVLEAAARKLMSQYERRLAKMNVKKVEFRYMQRSICGEQTCRLCLFWSLLSTCVGRSFLFVRVSPMVFRVSSLEHTARGSMNVYGSSVRS